MLGPEIKRWYVMEKFRKKMSGKRSRKLFSRTARRVHPKNNKTAMRGGIRI